MTTRANAWETLTFDFSKPVAGTAALNLSYKYNRLIIFFNFGMAGAAAGAQTYYFDDVLFATGSGTSSGNTGTCAAPNCTDFSAAGIGFGVFENTGGGTVEIANDPNDAANKVVKFVKKTGDNELLRHHDHGPRRSGCAHGDEQDRHAARLLARGGHQLPAQAGRRPGRRGGGEGRRHDAWRAPGKPCRSTCRAAWPAPTPRS